METLLKRYSPEQQKVIAAFWETIRWTRQTGKISESIKTTELEYWAQYEPKVVTRALEIHMDKAPNIREYYTRGIMRNLANGMATPQQGGGEQKPGPLPKTKKNRFANFQPVERDFEELERQEREYLMRKYAQDGQQE